jgi:hypothetical protein
MLLHEAFSFEERNSGAGQRGSEGRAGDGVRDDDDGISDPDEDVRRREGRRSKESEATAR